MNIPEHILEKAREIAVDSPIDDFVNGEIDDFFVLDL